MFVKIKPLKLIASLENLGRANEEANLFLANYVIHMNLLLDIVVVEVRG